MRLYPPVYVVGRETVREAEIGGYRVPRGTVLFMSQWIVHRDERYFPAPLSFKPERWDDGFARSLPRFAYFPFGGGARVCIGQPLALMEAKLVLATICQRFRLTDTHGEAIEPYASITLRPDRSIRPLVSRRPPADPAAARDLATSTRRSTRR